MLVGWGDSRSRLGLVLESLVELLYFQSSKKEANMPVKDLIAHWEEVLALALGLPDKRDAIELNDGDLTNVADRRLARIRSNVVAGARLDGLILNFRSIPVRTWHH